VNRWHASESIWDFKHCPLDQHGNRVQVAGEARQPKSEGLEGDRSSAPEWIKDPRQVAITRLDYLGAGLVKDTFVNARFPGNKPLKDVEKSPSFAVLIFIGWKPIRMS
jgi:hypothetical protein